MHCDICPSEKKLPATWSRTLKRRWQPWLHDLGSTPSLVTLLRGWMNRFRMFPSDEKFEFLWSTIVKKKSITLPRSSKTCSSWIRNNTFRCTFTKIQLRTTTSSTTKIKTKMKYGNLTFTFRLHQVRNEEFVSNCPTWALKSAPEIYQHLSTVSVCKCKSVASCNHCKQARLLLLQRRGKIYSPIS